MNNAPLHPTKEQISILLRHYESGRLGKAEVMAISFTHDFPKHQFGWLMLGILLTKSERHFEALNAYEIANSLSPQNARVLNNMGVTYKKLGRLKEAEISLRDAIALKPNYAEAHNNLGNIFKKMKELEKAEACFRKAVTYNPNLADAYNNLSLTLKDLGKFNQAFSACIKALHINQNFNGAYNNLSLIIRYFKFKDSNPKLYPLLINLLTIKGVVRPQNVAESILTLLKHDPLIKDLLGKKNIISNTRQVTSIIETLHQFKLLHHLMRICPLPDLELEALFVKIRRYLLFNIGKIKASDHIIYFFTTLCLQCFTNEYVYFESAEETKFINELEAKITETIMKLNQPELLKLLCLASYRLLHQYDWCQQLTALDQLDEIKKRLLEEPLAEKAIVKDIAVFGKISDEVSNKVREQYEQNPYPRWVNAIHFKGILISDFCDKTNLKLYSRKIKDVDVPKILVAGCGTGQHSLETATQFLGCHVTAVDLSLSSLAYAKRKAIEAKLSNLEYMQADILNLARLDKEFDIIESVGVLHHMYKPMEGWRVLTKLLKPGGLMRIGLYSDLARQHIVAIRKEIQSLGVGISDANMRQFRQSIITSEFKSHKELIKFNDFFSLSMLRDLVFHEQEHRFTLPQIANCLEELGLKFCGFGNKDVISNFGFFHGKNADIYDLELWHKYEENSPKTFRGMYQFWCQKL